MEIKTDSGNTMTPLDREGIWFQNSILYVIIPIKKSFSSESNNNQDAIVLLKSAPVRWSNLSLTKHDSDIVSNTSCTHSPLLLCQRGLGYVDYIINWDVKNPIKEVFCILH